MKIETTLQEKHQMTVTVELEQETIDKYNHRAARQIAKKVKFPGFRPGKAPDAIVIQAYGKEQVEAEALEMLLDDIYPEILKETELDPAGPGALESLELPKLVFSVPLVPVVELGDYRSLRKPYEPEEITEEDVENVLTDVRRSFATSEPVERPAKEGDLVFFEVSSKFTQPAEGEEADIFMELPYQMSVGEADDTGYFFDGFSNELAGLSENEEKTFKHVFPKDARMEALQDKEVEFHIKVQSVKEMELPELNDEFAKQVGEFETVEELRTAILESLQQRNTSEYDESYLGDVIDEIVESSTVKYADYTLQEEIDEILHSLRHDLEDQEMEMDAYLKSREMDLETFIQEEARPAAEKRLARSLVLREIAQKENLRLDNQELQNAVLQTMREMGSYMDPTMLKIKKQRDNLAQRITVDTANRLFNERLMNRIKDIASGALEEKEKQAALDAEAQANAEAEAEKQAEAQTNAQAEAEKQAETPAAEDQPAEQNTESEN